MAENKGPIIGLLGGIGSGKSTVATLLDHLGAVVLDADRYARDVLLDCEVRREIKKRFGENIFLENGQVDRARLADRIFENEPDRIAIQAIIHPRVRARMRERITEARTKSPENAIVLDIPLLLGSELRVLCDLLVMVRAPERTRIKRVGKTRKWDEKELRRREACQSSLEDKEKAADVYIDNDGTLEELSKKVEAFYKRILKR
jgi:dephospho-CoA kinase